jgi:hypothetical protein
MPEASATPLSPSGAPALESGAPTVAQRWAPQPYDATAVGRVAKGVQIRAIDLIGANFSRSDTTALPRATALDKEPELGVDVAYDLADDGKSLGCLLTFATVFPNVTEQPYSLTAQFRLVYDVRLGQPPAPEDLNQFAHWNAVFNAWPYWREYLSSTLNRARLRYFLVPVMGVPLPTTLLATSDALSQPKM